MVDSAWKAPERPEWVARINAEGEPMGIESLVPLDPEELIVTACRNTGFTNFGSDEWREPFFRVVQAINEEAELNLMGRLITRSDLLRWLEARLGIEEAYRQHPEIEAEVIDRPVVVVGRPRTGTSILYEILAQNPVFGSPKFWELTFPYPPPEAATYENDPRIERSDHLTKQWGRVTPTWNTTHECGARLPGECVYAMSMSFMNETGFGSWFHVPKFVTWLASQDTHHQYDYYKRVLKVLQWHNPRKHWLLKCPSHFLHLPELFGTFPDARVILTHRDPVASYGSLVNTSALVRYVRSDKKFIVSDNDQNFTYKFAIDMFEQVIDQMESGRIPAAQIHNSRYADLVARPMEALAKLYDSMGIELTASGRERMKTYIDAKPQGKFGKHVYDVGRSEEIKQRRKLAQRYQQYFNVPDEI